MCNIRVFRKNRGWGYRSNNALHAQTQAMPPMICMHTYALKTRRELKALSQPATGWKLLRKGFFFLHSLPSISRLFETNSDLASIAVWLHGNYGPTPEFSSKQVEAVAAISGNGDSNKEKKHRWLTSKIKRIESSSSLWDLFPETQGKYIGF